MEVRALHGTEKLGTHRKNQVRRERFEANEGKKVKTARQRGPQRRVLAALADPGLLRSTQWLPTVHILSSQGSSALSTPLLGLGTRAHTWYTHIHAYKTLIHTKVNESF